MKINAFLLLTAIPLLAACGGEESRGQSGGRVDDVVHRTPCSAPRRAGELPTSLSEASGIAASRRHPGTLWVHNDSGHDPVVFATDSTGRIAAEIRVEGARNRDWEDIAIGPCPTGDCLYIADTGDNRLRHEESFIYRIPEPAPRGASTATAERFPIRYPDGPRDVEAVYVLPGEELFLVSKGREHPAEIFRYPPPLRPGEIVTLELVQRLSEGALPLPDQITGADATPDGSWVAIRSYRYLQLHRPNPDGTLAPALPPPGLDLDPLIEPQGEGIAIRADGTIILVSEAGPPPTRGPIGMIDCDLGGIAP